MALLLDCDTGVDDALAILYALLTPGVEVCGIGGVWGNVPVDLATANSLRLVELVGRDVPVAAGAAGPITGRVPTFAPHVHGHDGQGNAGLSPPTTAPAAEHAAAQIVRLARARPGEIDLVAVGPLTNLALALALEPRLPGLVNSVTIMGGAADAPGNVTPAAEANIWCDPEAAAAVFAAGWPVTLVPLDVTMRVLMTDEHRRRLEERGTPVSVHAARMTDFYFDFFAANAFGSRCSPMHDVLAVAYAMGELRPRSAPLVDVVVDTGDGPGRGQTICDTRGRYRGYPEQGACRVLLDVDPAFSSASVVDRLSVWPPP
jgi:purine nucleosidase